MIAPWHQAYQDSERLLGQLDRMGTAPGKSAPGPARSAAYLMMLRLLTQPKEFGEVFRLGYSSFLCADLWAGGHQLESLIDRVNESVRRTIADTVGVVMTFVLNANNGMDALAEAERVFSPRPVAYSPNKIDLILAHLGAGHAYLLQGNRKRANEAFLNAGDLLFSGTRPNDTADLISSWFFEGASNGAWLPGGPTETPPDEIRLPDDQRGMALLLGRLAGILVAKELAVIELQVASQAADPVISGAHFKNAGGYLKTIRTLRQAWPEKADMTTYHLAHEFAMLELLWSARYPSQIARKLFDVALKYTANQRRDMVVYGRTLLKEKLDESSIPGSIANVVEVAKAVFIQQAEFKEGAWPGSSEDQRSAEEAMIREALPNLVLFDDKLSQLAVESKDIETIYAEFKAAARIQKWSWAQTIELFAKVLGEIKRIEFCNCDEDLLDNIVNLVTSLTGLHRPGVSLEPIYKVIRDWPLCPGHRKAHNLAGQLRLMGSA